MKTKAIPVLLIIAICCLFLASCSSKPPSRSDFKFSVTSPALEINCGKTVTYAAELKNRTGSRYVLSHGMPLITLYIYTPGEKPEDGVCSTLRETKISGLETIRKELSTQFTEPGEYRLRAYCSFSVQGENFHYEVDDYKIIVNE